MEPSKMPEIKCIECGMWRRTKGTNARYCLVCSKKRAVQRGAAWNKAHPEQKRRSDNAYTAKRKPRSKIVSAIADALTAEYKLLGQPRLDAEVWNKLAVAVSKVGRRGKARKADQAEMVDEAKATSATNGAAE